MDQQPVAALHRDLLGQDRDQPWLALRHEAVHQAEADAVDDGIELRADVGTAEHDIGILDRGVEKAQLRQFDQVIDVGDEIVSDQIILGQDRGTRFEIVFRGVQTQAIVAKFPRHQPPAFRARQADRDVRLALRQARTPGLGDQLDLDIGMGRTKSRDVTCDDLCAERFGGGDADRAAEACVLAGDFLVKLVRQSFDLLGDRQQAQAGIGQPVTAGRSVEQADIELFFERTDAPADRGVIDLQTRRRPHQLVLTR